MYGFGYTTLISSMGKGVATPSIVTSGLILNLDAGNPLSYNGSGTTWNDLSGYGNNGTLVNGVGYSATNGGSLIFDGVNDYIDNVGNLSTFNFIQNTNIFSINMWFKISNLSQSMLIMGNSTTTVEKGFVFTYRSPSSPATYGIKSLDFSVYNGTDSQFVSFGGTDNDTINSTGWYNICYTINNAQKGQFYINGVAVNTTIKGVLSANITNIKSTGNSARTLNIGRSNYSSTVLPLQGNISNVQIYNKELSTAEVLQNFNAIKDRYGY